MGGARDSIPVRLDRGEPVDVVIAIDAALEPLAKKGHIVYGKPGPAGAVDDRDRRAKGCSQA